MERQFKSWCWAWVLLGCWVLQPTTAQAEKTKRTVCGVDVSYQLRCYKELRKLEKACGETPVICGRTYKGDKTPSFKKSKQHCAYMHRKQRRRWREGLCGVRLFSRPKTYCGIKGVEVAVACVKQAQEKNQPAAGAVPVRPAPERSAPTTPAARKSPAPEASPASVQKPAAPAASVAPVAKKQAAVGQVQTVQPPTLESSNSGSSFWLYALQLLTLGLVFLLFWRRKERSSRPWEQRSRWSDVEEDWGLATETENSQMTRLEVSLEQIELRLQVWEEQWRDGQREHDPIVALQRWGESLRHYYAKLGESVAESRGRQTVSRVQRRLLEARDKMRWLFQAHREPPPLSHMVEKLQQELFETTDAVLASMGYKDGQEHIPQLLSQGEFSVDEFLNRKAEDQAQRFLTNDSLESFSSIRNEYLQCLEQLYRSNLQALLEDQESSESMAVMEQQQIYTEKYVLGFLLNDLPKMMEEYTRQSKRERCGPLVDQLLQFIAEELTSTGLELFPVFQAEEFISTNARLMYVERAGVRFVSQPSIVLRDADPALLQQTSGTDSYESAGANVSSEATAEYVSHSPEVDDPAVGVAVAMPSAADAHTAAYSQDLLRDIDEVIMSYDSPVPGDPNIANPDSDPPTAEVTTDLQGASSIRVQEELPPGPLPGFEGQKQPVGRAKITKEYGPLRHDSELPYSLTSQTEEPS